MAFPLGAQFSSPDALGKKEPEGKAPIQNQRKVRHTLRWAKESAILADDPLDELRLLPDLSSVSDAPSTALADRGQRSGRSIENRLAMLDVCTLAGCASERSRARSEAR